MVMYFALRAGGKGTLSLAAQRKFPRHLEGGSHVLDLSEGSSKLIPIHEEPNHQIVHLFRLGKAQRPTHSPLDTGPENEASPQQAAGYQTEGPCRGDTVVSPPSSLCKVTSEQAPRNLLIDVLTLDFLCVLLPHVMLLGLEMPLVGP